MAVCYGSSIKEERKVIEDEISKFMHKPLLLGGNFNGIPVSMSLRVIVEIILCGNG